MKTGHIFIVVSLMALAAVADAGLTKLPESSHYSGTSYYNVALGNNKILSGRIEFAVYDTQTNPNEFVGSDGFSAPGQGRYIYAYQIINYSSNNFGMTNAAIPFFTILGISPGAVSSLADVGTTADTPDPGVDATSKSMNIDQTQVVYEFANGVLAAGKNSWFLLMRSNNDWKKGSYKFDTPDDDDIVAPGDESNEPIPEPATLSMLLIGSLALYKRRFA